MKKTVSLLVVSLLLVSGTVLTGVATNLPMITSSINEETNAQQTLTTSIHFSPPEVVDKGTYTIVKTNGADHVLRTSTTPMLPYWTDTWAFPVGTTIVDVDVAYG